MKPANDDKLLKEFASIFGQERTIAVDPEPIQEEIEPIVELPQRHVSLEEMVRSMFPEIEKYDDPPPKQEEVSIVNDDVNLTLQENKESPIEEPPVEDVVVKPPVDDVKESFLKDLSILLRESKQKKLKEDRLLDKLDSFFSQPKEEEKPQLIPEQEEIIQEEIIQENVSAEETRIEEEEVKEEIKQDTPPSFEKQLSERALQILGKGRKKVDEMFNQPNPPEVNRDLKDITQKIKYLEAWISRIASTGPGGGEVRLEFLDDVNRDSVKVDGKFLQYNASSGKWIGADGGSGGANTEVVVDLINQNERLVYTTVDQYRIVTGYREDDEVLSIRATAIAGAHLRFELASFSPSVSASGQSLAWDQAATGFSVSVDNPTDFTERWINSVSLIDNATGVHTTLSDYSSSGPSATPAGGVDWTQTFSTNGTATIRSNGTGLSGGSASARITFKDNDNDDWGTKPTISFTWGSVGHSITFANLTGKTFLDYYSSVGYTVSVTGFSSGANYVNTVTGSGGTPSNGSGSGTFTFTTGLHKNNNTSRSVSLSTNFNRPVAVTGTAYTVQNSTSDNTISASFSYPSFYYWTINTLTPPTRADIVDGYGFESAVTQLGDQTRIVNGFINNSDSNPRAFWFGVRSAAAQPSSFQTGPTSALLSDTAVTTGNSLNLEPDSPLAGYVAEGYTLYGITLQPGNTYVSIS